MAAIMTLPYCDAAPTSNPKYKSWIPIIAPDTPPPTPPESDLPDVLDSEYFATLDLSKLQRVEDVKVAVIGTGYVGLHLVEAFSDTYNVIAFDISEKRVREVEKLVEGKPVTCTTDKTALSQATHFLIAVSTLVDNNQNIDTSYIRSAIETIRMHARPGSTVIIESSVAVGMTRDLLQPLMESHSLLCGMSPERVDPGRVSPSFESIPKIISGLDDASLSSIHTLYSRVFQRVVPVSSPEVAEMTKLYENCQRMMCIAYANEMADACRQLSTELSRKQIESKAQQEGSLTAPINIDPWEVARAASTKPFGYMPYTPSLGVGGHCIPVNPYYLLSNSDFPLLEACTERMRTRPARIADRIISRLGESSTRRKSPIPAEQARVTKASRPHILIVGLGFKRGQSTLSHSPGKAFAVHLLSNYEVYVEFADPLVEQSAVPFIPRLDEKQDWILTHLKSFDAIVVAVDQPGLDMALLDEVEAEGTLVEIFCNK